MRLKSLLNSGAIGTILAAGLAAGLVASVPAPVAAATVAPQPTETLTLSVGRGQMVRLAAPMSDLFVADDKVADVQVRSPNQLYVFGKGAGETTVYATNKAGTVVWSSTVRVGSNLSSVGQMLKLAMPDAAIVATPMNGLVLLTGTVATPGDVEEAQRLVQAFVGEQTQVVSRLKTATPLQVNLHVKIAEVNREFAKQVGVNIKTADPTSGFLFGIGQGRQGALTLPSGTSGGSFTTTGVGTTIGMFKHLFGLDIATAIDLAENDGLVTTLAEPNLTAISGETASFLAGGEIPIPLSQGLGSVSIEYKQYGVSLAFTPTVIDGNRISMRVRPEVSQLSSAGSVQINGFTVPGITTRRAETTVELGSGQAFMIGGLLSNNHNNSIDKAPFLGDLPILGALFRSNNFKRSETELVIIVTPYLVKPVSASQIALPTDGYKAATDAQRLLLGQAFDGKTGEKRPVPKTAPPVTSQPGIGSIGPGAAAKPAKGKKTAAADPGFSFN
jgi:pilus assembly protein CpaC